MSLATAAAELPSRLPSTPLPPTVPLRAGQHLGRFRLLAELGRGAQATVWRALDERLQREVALKLFSFAPEAGHSQAADEAGGWLHEARAVSRLSHPHIVPVFDADLVDGRAALVFELVPGPTLSETLKRNGAMPARAAVELMLGVVDALRIAHEQGIVHRDLKPSNILIDAAGRARVMDFGIAARIAPGAAAPTERLIAGTPGYLSPEGARGDAPSPQMDVFAAGVILAEMLQGQRLLQERDVRRALERVQSEDLQLADSAAADDRLRALVQRALARDPAARFDSAASLRDALMQWLEPPDEVLPLESTGHGTLDFLLRRMRHKSDFPALSQRVVRIQRMAASESETLPRLADEILQDVALTGKLLRLVNSAHFRRDPQGVATVSRAVALVGLAGIRNLALSLVLVEHMKDKAHAQRLRECFLRALLAGQMAQELVGNAREAEEAFLGAMFYNLGPLLAEYYFPDEADAVREQLARTPSDGRTHPDTVADRVAAQVLGLGWEALGMGVARHWGLPEALQQCMRRPSSASPSKLLPPGHERLRWLAVASNEAAEALWAHEGEALVPLLDGVSGRHGRALGLGTSDLRRAAENAHRALHEMAPALGLTLPKRQSGLVAADAAAGAGSTDATLLVAPEPAAAPAPVVAAVAEMLSAGLADITDLLAADTVQINTVLRRVLDTIHTALGCRRVVFCMRDPATGRLRGRFGLGDQAEALAREFQICATPAPGSGGVTDLFARACQQGTDSVLPDLADARLIPALPAWFRQRVPSGACLLLPLMLRNAPFALIYADRAGSLPLGERERSLLRSLRNQAVLAFRQAG
ncbi:MAG: HDOD domain-containing protein [Burkholderiaceae bacterium]|nr:HDOD domain-containing protein [Burkholderiaceae bacterium]